MPRLILVRHGVTETNETRKFTGQSDIDLNEEGYRQVKKLRDRLAGEKIDVIYSSDLKRTMETAGPISSSHSLEIISCPELRELDYGVCEGMTYREINEQYPELGRHIAEVNPEMQFPGGECFQDLSDRAEKFLKITKTHGEDDSILAVSHGGMIRTLICQLLGLELGHWSSFRIDNASVSIIDIYTRRTIISLLNDTSRKK